MTEGKLQKIIDLRKAIAICECIIGISKRACGYRLKPRTPRSISQTRYGWTWKIF